MDSRDRSSMESIDRSGMDSSMHAYRASNGSPINALSRKVRSTNTPSVSKEQKEI